MEDSRDVRGVLMGVGISDPKGGLIDISIAGAVVDFLLSSPFLNDFFEAGVKYP